jgi:hypothetical protein
MMSFDFRVYLRSNDDQVVIYAALRSGPNTYFLSRDSMTNIVAHMPSNGYILFKWLLNRRINFFYSNDLRMNVSFAS